MREVLLLVPINSNTMLCYVSGRYSTKRGNKHTASRYTVTNLRPPCVPQWSWDLSTALHGPSHCLLRVGGGKSDVNMRNVDEAKQEVRLVWTITERTGTKWPDQDMHYTVGTTSESEPGDDTNAFHRTVTTQHSTLSTNTDDDDDHKHNSFPEGSQIEWINNIHLYSRILSWTDWLNIRGRFKILLRWSIMRLHPLSLLWNLQLLSHTQCNMLCCGVGKSQPVLQHCCNSDDPQTSCRNLDQTKHPPWLITGLTLGCACGFGVGGGGWRWSGS